MAQHTHSPYLEDIPLADALARWWTALAAGGLDGPLSGEPIDLADALGRITAEPVWARVSSPHYHAAAMDGYAVHAEDTRGASETQPVQLSIGRQAFYVDTGDPLPPGANAVIMVEDVQVKDRGSGSAGAAIPLHGTQAVPDPQSLIPSPQTTIEILAPVAPWQHVRPMGEDMVATELILPANHRLRPQDIGAAAGAGHARLMVRRRPRVAIQPTGTELVAPGSPLRPGDIIEYNSLVLAAMIREWGGEPECLPPLSDDYAAIRQRVLDAAATHDLVIVNAGSSAGSEDFTARIVAELGELLVHGIAIRPGHPVILGMVGGLGTGDWGQGTGGRGQGAGDWGLGTGDWGQGTGDWGLGTGDWGLGTGDWGQESGDRGQESGDRGQESGDRGQESGIRGQGTGEQLPISNPQSPTPNPQSPTPNPQSPTPDPRSPIPDPQSPIPDPRSPIPNLQSPTPIIGLPGYPVSAAMTCELLVQPTVARWLGQPVAQRPTVEATLTRKVVSPAGEEEFLRVTVGQVGDRMVATPLPGGSGVLMSLVRADGLVRIPRGEQGFEPGAPVTVSLFKSPEAVRQTIVAIGSHDLTLDLLADELGQRYPGRDLSSANVGSLGGLLTLARGEAHLAGSHLLDEATGDYNESYIRRLLPGVPVILLGFVQRQQGLILPRGNPKRITGLADLARPDVIFINRQRGAGTRVLLDYRLRQLDINPRAIQGYERQEFTHLAVAAAVASGAADCGLGILAAARALNLDFAPLDHERYDLVIPAQFYRSEILAPLLEIICDPAFAGRVRALGGYETPQMGQVLAEIR